jgi:hypothetical protein
MAVITPSHGQEMTEAEARRRRNGTPAVAATPLVVGGMPGFNAATTTQPLNRSSRTVQPNFAHLQTERWLAAESPIASGVASQINLIAQQECWVDLSRLCVQVFPLAESALALGKNTFNYDLNQHAYIQQITFDGDQRMVQGQPLAPAVTTEIPASFFSPARDITGWDMQGAGQWWHMSTRNEIQITILQNSGLAASAAVAAPCVLKCDLGQSAYPSGFQPPGKNYLGAQIVASSVSGNVAIAANVTLQMTLNSAGLLNWNAMQVVGSYSDVAAAATSGGNTLNPYCNSQITSITDFQRQEYVQGVSVGGNPIRVPLACYMPAGVYPDRAGSPWCRLPAQAGSSGNSVSLIIDSTLATAAGAGVTRQLSVGAPFYGQTARGGYGNDPLACQG